MGSITIEFVFDNGQKITANKFNIKDVRKLLREIETHKIIFIENTVIITNNLHMIKFYKDGKEFALREVF